MNAHARGPRALAVMTAVVCLFLGHDLVYAQHDRGPAPRPNDPRGYQPTNIAKKAQIPLPSGDVPKPAPPTRPWWDWLGVTETETKVQQVRPKSSAGPAKKNTPARSASGMPKLKVVDEGKPWWDWLGVTGKPEKKRQVLRVGTRQQEKPWWDWLGVTEASKPSAVRPARRRGSQAAERPWWDWLGMTDPPPRQPGPALPRTRMGPLPKTERPWWDMLGVTEDDSAKKR